jgi:hypothetical protein
LQPKKTEATTVSKRRRSEAPASSGAATVLRRVSPGPQEAAAADAAAMARDPATQELMENAKQDGLDKIMASATKLIEFNRSCQNNDSAVNVSIAQDIKKQTDTIEELRKESRENKEMLNYVLLQVEKMQRQLQQMQQQMQLRPSSPEDNGSAVFQQSSTPMTAARTEAAPGNASLISTPNLHRSTSVGVAITDIDVRCSTLSKYDQLENYRSPIDFSETADPQLIHLLRAKSNSAVYFAKLVSRLAKPGFQRFKFAVGATRIEGRIRYPEQLVSDIVRLTQINYPGTSREVIVGAINEESRKLLSEAKYCHYFRLCVFCKERTQGNISDAANA